jgi:hypothetical protein
VSGQTRAGVTASSAVVYYEPIPRKMSVDEAAMRSVMGVGFPDNRDIVEPEKMDLGEDGTFSFDYDFPHGADKVYTVMIWALLEGAEPDDTTPLTNICLFVND